MQLLKKSSALAIVLTFAFASCGKIEVNESVAQPDTEFELIGVIRTKTLSQTHNDLTVGCEVLDRDYTDYHKYKDYLEELGIHKIRLQAGWAKTEKEKGVYDFAWLDSIIDDAVARGLQPWLETSYGNPIYEGGGTKYLAGGWPVSDEALAAWDNWVRAMAERYKGKVREWEIWNEPDLNAMFYQDRKPLVDLQIRTAEIIKSVDPDARIAAFAWCGWHPDEFTECLSLLKERGKLDLFEWISYHFYHYRPEDMYSQVADMQDSLDKFTSGIVLRQGESGAPSAGHMGGALSEYDWSEISQGKWALRRMISDHGKGIPTTIFCICDMNYTKDKDSIKKKNLKGLLETDADNNIVRKKESFYAVQNLVALWELMDECVPATGIRLETEESHSIYEFKDRKGGKSFAVWMDSRTPDDNVVMNAVNVGVEGFRHPVCVDIRSGNVYKAEIETIDGVTRLKIPMYDSPVFVVEKESINLK